MINKLTLHTRITLLVGSVILAIALLLTFTSIRGANHYFTGNELNKVIVEPGAREELPKEDIVDKNLSATLEVIDPQKQFAMQSVFVMGVIIVVGIGLTYFLVGRVLKPLTQLSKTIQEIHEQNLSTQIDVPPTNDEVSSLSKSFNAMLQRLESSFTRQKRFSENAAHELKTPLTTMKTSLQVLHLDENPRPEDYKENAAAMAESTERLIGLVDGLLALAFEAHTEFKDVLSLQAVYQDIAKELRPFAQRNDVIIEIKDGDCYLQCNHRLLYRAIYNLVENAVKYNRQGGRVQLAACREDNRIVLTIRDYGIGIAADEIDKLFEAFYRSKELKSSETGSGLGLPLVKTIIEKHDGEIDVESVLGEGTIVRVILPLQPRGEIK